MTGTDKDAQNIVFYLFVCKQIKQATILHYQQHAFHRCILLTKYLIKNTK